MAKSEGQGDMPHVARGDSKIEWYTPLWILEGVRAVMGDIDLDPASCEAAQMLVRAKSYYTMADDGLAHEWFGRVFMNPPYARYMVTAWADKFVVERYLGHISEGMVLCNNATETIWFQTLAANCNALCTIRSRVKFWGAGTASNVGLQGQALLYYGDHIEEFTHYWRDYGQVWVMNRNMLFYAGDEMMQRVIKLAAKGRLGNVDSPASGDDDEDNSGLRTAAQPDCTMARG